MRGFEPDLLASPAAAGRRIHAAQCAIAALHPRDETELTLGVQIVSASNAANAAWSRAAREPNGDNRRHIAAAGQATRIFDAMLRALERRQARPLGVPVGRPAPRTWARIDPVAVLNHWNERLGPADVPPDPVAQRGMTDDAYLAAWAIKSRHLKDNPNDGLDIANTQGILPDGGMILPWNPDPAQAAYMERRLLLMYLREREENQRNGIQAEIKFRPLRPGDIIP